MNHDLSPVLRKYLRQVLRKLNLPGSIRRRISNDLKTSMLGKQETGMTDREIIACMGSPKEVAAEFHEQMPECCYRKHPLRFVCLGLSVLSFLALIYEFLINRLLTGLLNTNAESIGIIGGADGPTTVFITSTVRKGLSPDTLVFLTVMILGLVGYFWFRRRKKKE